MILGMSAQPTHRHPIHLTERGELVRDLIYGIAMILILPFAIAATLWMTLP